MEGDAGPGRLIPAASPGADASVDVPEDTAEPAAGATSGDPPRRSSRIRRRGVIGICAALILAAAAVAAGGYLALRSDRESREFERSSVSAMKSAEDCVAATQAPDIDTLSNAQQKMMDCATGDFGAQAALYSGVLMEAYKAADVHVHITEMRTAVERSNPDGSMDLLLAMRVKVDNTEAKDREFGYRLRVRMEQEEGQYKVAKLDQVAT